jgi:hypothetical protein
MYRVTTSEKPVEIVSRVVIRFAGDSGDGMQLTGERFTAETANLGNDIESRRSSCSSLTPRSSPPATTPTSWSR